MVLPPRWMGAAWCVWGGGAVWELGIMALLRVVGAGGGGGRMESSGENIRRQTGRCAHRLRATPCSLADVLVPGAIYSLVQG